MFGRTCRPSQGPPAHQRGITMNRTHLRPPTSRGSLFQWSVADRTVAACGIGPIGEQHQSGLRPTARIADDRGRSAAHHDRRAMNRKVFSGKPLRRGTRPEVAAAEKKPRFRALRALIGRDFQSIPRRSWPRRTWSAHICTLTRPGCSHGEQKRRREVPRTASGSLVEPLPIGIAGTPGFCRGCLANRSVAGRKPELTYDFRPAWRCAS